MVIISMSNTFFIILVNIIFAKIHPGYMSLFFVIDNDFKNLLINPFTKLLQNKLNKTFMQNVERCLWND